MKFYKFSAGFVYLETGHVNKFSIKTDTLINLYSIRPHRLIPDLINQVFIHVKHETAENLACITWQ